MRHQFGFVRVAAVSNRVEVGNPAFNGKEFTDIVHNELFDADIICGQELGITAYTCANLFQQQVLLDAAQLAVKEILSKNYTGRLIVVGCPIPIENSLYNCAVVINGDKVIGIVPKQYLPNYKEFYEGRWFRGADGREPKEVLLPILGSKPIPFGVDLLFGCENAEDNITVGIEICEDLWMPIPPSSYQALKGATILLNLSASNETVAKSKYRRDLVVNQSGRCMAAYVYASAGPSESSTDLVFGGHCMIAENGSLLTESDRVGNGKKVRLQSHSIVADVDVQKLQFDRRQTTSYDDQPVPREYRKILFHLNTERDRGILRKSDALKRKVNGLPFIPRDKSELDDRCAEIFGIQVASMMKRFSSMGHTVKPVIGVSGGLDSTLALLALVKTFENMSIPVSYIRGITMPGFGTTARTKSNATNLMEFLGVSQETIDIRPMALQAFRDMGHKPFGIELGDMDVKDLTNTLHDVPVEKRHDLVFENVQARLRTFVLMSKGFVVGTGDLTEAALGWCTYNGDHMSMYNPNCSVPKTLVQFLVQYAAEKEFDGGVRNCLLDIVGTPISPELLPVAGDGTIQQTTEGTLGAFELHDFFLFNFIRNGYSPEKILWLTKFADFTRTHNVVDIEKALALFVDRFFGNQFKRSCVPDGPKLGSVSLSPRGDWRMPSDAVANVWKNQVKS